MYRKYVKFEDQILEFTQTKFDLNKESLRGGIISRGVGMPIPLQLFYIYPLIPYMYYQRVILKSQTLILN